MGLSIAKTERPGSWSALSLKTLNLSLGLEQSVPSSANRYAAFFLSVGFPFFLRRQAAVCRIRGPPLVRTAVYAPGSFSGRAGAFLGKGREPARACQVFLGFLTRLVFAVVDSTARCLTISYLLVPLPTPPSVVGPSCFVFLVLELFRFDLSGFAGDLFPPDAIVFSASLICVSGLS